MPPTIEMTTDLGAHAARSTTSSPDGARWPCSADARSRSCALADEEVYAVDHHDPHTGAPVMARGIVGSRGDRPTIASPLHKEVYDLGTGECFTDGSLALRTYRTRIVGGMIEVELDG